MRLSIRHGKSKKQYIIKTHDMRAIRSKIRSYMVKKNIESCTWSLYGTAKLSVLQTPKHIGALFK